MKTASDLVCVVGSYFCCTWVVVALGVLALETIVVVIILLLLLLFIINNNYYLF